MGIEMNVAPDVLGLGLAEARRRLGAAGVPVAVSETSPPRGPIAGELRVVRQHPHGDGLRLVAAAFPRLVAQESSRE